MPQTVHSLQRPAMWPAAVALGLAMAAFSHPTHGKLPPPTQAEQAASAKQAETERAQKAQEQAQLTEAQNRLAARFGKGGNNAPDATTPAANLPKSVVEAPGSAGPHGGSRPSAESHSGNAR
ncbi:hypothetical protein [Ralstonia sp. SET104]|uniref:hypothetical protein n=1 Tax=Ralstonia sp. SET104 TaxID=2448774 RepID=UPI000F586B47|nr:hypothetical protein [Ralstonia sp. SET104]GCB06513.1 hypothetical protein PSUB009319_41440 [Ralstonia sp. SET104]